MSITQRKTTEFDKFHKFLMSGGINPPQDNSPPDNNNSPPDNNNNRIILSIIAVSCAIFSLKRCFR
jgi:hypothetical protein